VGSPLDVAVRAPLVRAGPVTWELGARPTKVATDRSLSRGTGPGLRQITANYQALWGHATRI